MNNSIQAWAAAGRTQLLFVQRPGSTLPPGGIVVTAAVPGASIVAVPWLGGRTDDMSTPAGFAAATGTPFAGGAYESDVVAKPPALAAITAVAQSAANPFDIVNHSGYTATPADQAALCLVRSLTRASDVLADAEYAAFVGASQLPAAVAGSFNTVGDALFAQGGVKGSMTPAATILWGPYPPTPPYTPHDSVLGTVVQEKLRYVGASPAQAGTGAAGQNVGERTNVQGLQDIVNDSRNFLKIAASAKASVLADIALNTGGVAYYDLNNIMFGSQYASDWITAQHAALFPPATVSPQPPTPPAQPPVVPPAPATSVTLLSGRFTVSCAFTGPNVTGAGVAVQETDDAVHFLFPASYSDSLHPQVEVSLYDQVASSGSFWVFVAAETTVPFAVTVTNVATKQIKTYTSSAHDTSAF